MKTKIYIPCDYRNPRGSLKILVDGVNNHDQLELVENEEESD